MSARVAAVLAWSLWTLSVAFAAFGLLFLYLSGSFEHVLDESMGVDVTMAVAFPTVGAVIASRKPGNAVGWIFCAIGLCGGASIFFSEYGIFALVTRPGSLPAGVIATWIGTWVWLPSGTLTISFFATSGWRSRSLSFWSEYRPCSSAWPPSSYASGAREVRSDSNSSGSSARAS